MWQPAQLTRRWRFPKPQAFRMSEYDCLIVGAGIVGLGTALAIRQKHPNARIAIVDKEPRVAAHQTGHNSGVIHAGIYYKPGSLKARLCVDGARRMFDFCAQHNVPHARVGKLIVATSEAELARLDALVERAQANGVAGFRRITAQELRKIEPRAAGIAAIHSPNTGITDYGAVAQAMRDLLVADGVEARTDTRVTALADGSPIRAQTSAGELRARTLINCAGLHCDVVARMMGLEPGLRIVPFRGEYYTLKPHAQGKVRGLIYPVPDPNFPFLGVHFTRMVGGGVEAGPNAVFAFAREGYTMRAVSVRDTFGALTYPGFIKVAGKWWRAGAYEFYRSFRKAEFVRSLQKLIPSITAQDVERRPTPAHPMAGLRAQAISQTGELVDDFRFLETERALHVLNAPSPAATASLTIGEYIAGKAERLFG